MRVCICIDARGNMSDKCESAIIFTGANYQPLSGAMAASCSYIESLVLFFLCVSVFLLSFYLLGDV